MTHRTIKFGVESKKLFCKTASEGVALYLRPAAVIVTLVLFSAYGAFSRDISWTRVAMDGSRSRVETKLLRGTAAKEARILEKCAPAMAPHKETIGRSAREMSAYAPQSPLGNWFADLSLEQGAILCGERCDVAIANIGGIRVDLPAGNVIAEDILSMFPFSSRIAIVKTKGYNLRIIFSRMARNGWQAFSGAKVVAGNRTLKSVEVAGQPLDDDRIYTIVTNEFILDGGDDMYIAQNALECRIYDKTIYEFAMDFIQRKNNAGEMLDAALDDRLILNGSATDENAPVTGNNGTTDGSSLQAESGSAPHRRNPSRRLTILHTNDTHSHLEPVRSGKYAEMGGIVERGAFIDSVRRADGKRNVLLLDAGDYSQGTTYFTTFHGMAEIKAMNAMGYDVATIGNHEWDNGPRDLCKRLKKARFKTTLCNYDIADRKLGSILKPYVIIRRGGLKIGIIGTLVDVMSVVNKDVASGIRYNCPSDPVNKWADHLKNRCHCDLVIVLSHCGLTQEYGDMWDMKMAGLLHNVDMIIGGHTHSNLTEPVYVDDADGNPVMIVTDYLWGLYIGVVKI